MHDLLPAPGRALESEDFLHALYQRHGSVLLRYAARLLGGDWHRAEDVWQEAAIRAWRHAATLDPSAEDLRPWLFAVVRNLVIDGHRAQQARPPETGARPDVRYLPVPDGVDQALSTQVVVDAMRELAPLQCEALLYVHYLGLSVAQAARALGVPPGTVKSRTHYAMRALREELRSRGLATL